MLKLAVSGSSYVPIVVGGSADALKESNTPDHATANYYAYCLSLSSFYVYSGTISNYKNYGFSVRCVSGI